MTDTVILHYAPDNASLCVRLALLELDLPFETVLVDRARHEQKSPAFLAMNPNGTIPVIETAEGTIHETAAILLWLADSVPGAAFPGVDDPGRGAALTQLFWLSNTLHPALRLLFYPERVDTVDPDDLRIYVRDQLCGLFAQLDADPQAGWLAADGPQILGCYLAPMLRWCALYGGETSWFDLSNYPRLQRFAENFDKRPAMQAAARAEGLGRYAISVPQPCHPPEGSAV